MTSMSRPEKSENEALHTSTFVNAPRADRQKHESRFGRMSPSSQMEKPMQKFIARYEDNAKAEAEAKRCGWDSEDGGMLDYLNGDLPHTARAFPTKVLAEAWIKSEIAAGKTVFSCGDIAVVEWKEPRGRCQYCTCRGWHTTQEFIVEDTGIVEEREINEECCNDDD